MLQHGINNSVFNLHFMKVSTEIDNNFVYGKITQLVDNIPLSHMRFLDVVWFVDGQNHEILKPAISGFYICFHPVYRPCFYFIRKHMTPFYWQQKSLHSYDDWNFQRMAS
jgi:hypothetical protein